MATAVPAWRVGQAHRVLTTLTTALATPVRTVQCAQILWLPTTVPVPWGSQVNVLIPTA